MDFEEQLEKAEKLSSPSLVGSSVRSADDSPHNNYIHPEKYQGHDSAVDDSKKKQLRNKELSASLDELINEGALIGSEEDFDELMDEEGSVRSDAKYVGTSKLSQEIGGEDEEAGTEETGTEAKETGAKETEAEPKENDQSNQQTTEQTSGQPKGKVMLSPEANSSANFLSNSDSHTDLASTGTPSASGFYSQQDFSNPNLSEYQLNNQIKDHDDLLSKIKQDDPHRLSKDFSKENACFMKASNSGNASQDGSKEVSFNPLPLVDGHRGPEGFHSPYFRRDDRSESANRSRSRSRSRSAMRPHLARGDSYTNVHTEDPSKYELPPDFKPVEDVEEPTDRRSRQSKPTMGESIAAIEEEEKINSEKYQSQVMSRDASLLTTGDYTNFNVDNPDPEPTGPYKFNSRSNSSTNYLRSISRSRSRQPGGVGITGSGAVDTNEKNDANPSELYKEGALINEDPYSTIDNLDSMMKKVLDKKSADGEKGFDEIQEKPEDETSKVFDENDESKETEDRDESKVFEAGEIEEEKKKSEDVEPEVDDNKLAESAVETAAVPEEDNLEEEDSTKEEDTEEKEENPLEEKVAALGISEAKDDISEAKEDLESKDISETKADPESKEVSESKSISNADTSDDLDDLDISPEELRKHLESQPVYLLTSLIGGMQVIHKTNRLQTILKANEIEFTARDLSTDEEAKKIWRRHSNGKSLPGIIRGDDFIGNWEDLDEANEEYRVRELIYETL